MALKSLGSRLMRAFSLILGAFCLAGCTSPPDIVPLQGVVPPLAHAGEAGVIARVPVDVVFAPPKDASVTKLENPQARYDDAVRHGQLKEANRVGLGTMTGSQPCGAPGDVIAPPTALSKPCGVEPLDDFSLGARRR
jgi:hypothetical protein